MKEKELGPYAELFHLTNSLRENVQFIQLTDSKYLVFKYQIECQVENKCLD